MKDDESGGGASRTTRAAWGSSEATDVSQKEYFNEKIGHDRQQNRERFGFILVVGCVVWFFIERHLKDLNHENARVASVAENTVSSDTYRSDEQRRRDERDKLDDWRKGVDSDRTQSVSRDDLTRENQTDKRAGVGMTAALVAMAVGLAGVGLTVLAIVLSTQ